MTDLVNHPAHYTVGAMEAIDVIECAIADALFPAGGYLQGQVLKYVLRLWLKGNASQDAKKARWYLDRHIANLEP